MSVLPEPPPAPAEPPLGRKVYNACLPNAASIDAEAAAAWDAIMAGLAAVVAHQEAFPGLPYWCSRAQECVLCA